MVKLRVTFILVGAAAISLAAMPSKAAAEEELVEALPWIKCLVKTARGMATSPDAANLVADAALAICSELEGPVRIALERQAVASLVRDGVVADQAEGRQIAASIGDRGWRGYLARMQSQLLAVVIQMRQQPVLK